MRRKQTCPRRMTEFGPWKAEENQDTWSGRGGIIGQEKIGPGCSFCGSLHPDRFMELIRQGWIVGPTDKSYKAYLGKPLTDEEKASRRAEWDKLGMADMVEHQTGQEAKFYYQHLSEDQRREFIGLCNSGEMKIGYPGHFYVSPFFACPVKDAER